MSWFKRHSARLDLAQCKRCCIVIPFVDAEGKHKDKCPNPKCGFDGQTYNRQGLTREQMQIKALEQGSMARVKGAVDDDELTEPMEDDE